MNESIFLRLLSCDDKAAALADAVNAVREGPALNPVVHQVDPASFRQVPGSPFAYWVSERIRRLFTELPPFESDERTVKQGLATADDFRFVRAWWEVQPEKILDGANGPDWREDLKAFQHWCRQRTFEGKRWVPFAKGGEYSPYYADIHLVVNWQRDGEKVKAWICERYEYLNGKWEWVAKNTNFYFRPGLTWPRRTNGLSFRTLTAGCIFADKGPVAIAPYDSRISPLVLATLMNSLGYYFFVQMLVARVSLAQSFEIGLIQSIPIPPLQDANRARLRELGHGCWNLKLHLDNTNETSHVFQKPALLQDTGDTLAKRIAAWQARLVQGRRQLTEYQREIDEIAFRLYGIEGDDRRAIEESLRGQLASGGQDEETDDAEETGQQLTTDHRQVITDLLSYTVGCVFGRWDVRLATGERQPPELPDPFAPLPVCSPGMLTGEDGLPLREAPAGYPLDIDWDGILVDDPDHSDDILRRVRDALEVIFNHKGTKRNSSENTSCLCGEHIEQETCEILGVKELRDYFGKPGNGGFWMDHVRRYSKSRRKAPIYWLLQSSKKNYALWLYYHRLDKDILFKALVNYVEPKLRLEENRLEQTRKERASAGTSGGKARQLEKQIDRQEALLSELRDFNDKLRRAAELHLEPDLNDGVILNIAPLWELVPWKEAKKYWNELLEGKYEWSSIGKQLREREILE